MKFISTTIVLSIGILIGYCVFNGDPDPNLQLMYGSTGFPKNCRAIIKANVDGYHTKQYKAEEALDSINRNCGEFGYSWVIDK